MRRRPIDRKLGACLGLVGLLAAACGGGQEQSGDEPAAAAGATGVELPAEACSGEPVAGGPGVTEDEVAVGVMALDMAPLADVGFAEDMGDVNAIWQAAVDRANDDGGVCGRTLVIDHQATWNTLAPDAERQACVELTEDTDLLAVMATAGTSTEAIECITDTGDTPLLVNVQVPEATFEHAGGRLLTLPPSAEEAASATVAAYSEAELLDGSVGILYGGEEPTHVEPVEDVLVPALEEQGIDPVTCKMPAGASSPDGGAQLPLCIEELEAAGVDVVVEAVDVYTMTRAVLEAETQGWDPVWLGTTLGGTPDSAPLFLRTLGAAEAYDGAYNVNHAAVAGEDYELDPVATECNEHLAGTTDMEFEEGSLAWINVGRTCATVDSLVAAAEAAGGDLTRERLMAGFETLDDLAISGQGPSSLAAGEHAMGDAVRLVSYSATCDCFRTEGDWVELSE